MSTSAGGRRRLRALAIAVLAASLVSGLAHGAVSRALLFPDSLISVRRSEGQYREALELAVTGEAALRASGAARVWQIADAERLVATLRIAAALPESLRRRLAAADGADGEIRRRIIAGEYLKAAERVEQQLEVRRRVFGPDHQEVARSLQRLAELLSRRFEVDRALRTQEEVLHLRRRILGERHPEVAESLQELGYDLKLQGLDGAAERVEQAFRQALELRRELLEPDDPAVLSSLFALADLSRWQRDFPAAEAGLREVLALRERRLGPDHPDVVATLGVLAYVLCVQGRYEDAVPLARRAAESSLRVRAVDQVDRAFALSACGYTLLHRGQPAEAERYFTRTARIHEQLRRENRYDPLSNNVQLTNYVARAQAQLLQGKDEEAWRSLERGTNRRLLDALAAPEPWPDPPPPPDRDLPDGRFLSLGQVQAAIPAGAALIGWLDLAWSTTPREDGFYGYVIRRSGPVHWFRSEVGDPALRPYSRMISFCGEIYDVCRSPVRVTDTGREDRLARELYKERFAPLEPHLAGVGALIVVQSSAAFSPVPVEALVDSSGCSVGERFDVSYTPSATIFARLRADAPRPAAPQSWRALLVGDPLVPSIEAKDPADTVPQLPPLAASREEVLGAASNFRAPTVLLEGRASTGALRTLAASGEIRTFDLIHFATHVLPPVGSYMGALALSPGSATDSAHAGRWRREDVLLDAREIASWNLDADLVTLSGCLSGGLGYSTDAPIGLSKFFLMGGARSVLASLWRVDDTATSLLMRRFYENICRPGGGTMSKPAALREAKIWLRNLEEPDGSRLFRHPAYWAGFVLIGDAID